MAWTINAPFPGRFIRELDDRVLDLTDREALVHSRLYQYACDEYGRFIVSEASLRIATGLATGKPIVPVVKKLAGLGLLVIYSDGKRQIAELERYDEDLGARQREKRAPSMLPGQTSTGGSQVPPQGVAQGVARYPAEAPMGTLSGGSSGGSAGGSAGGSQVPPQVPLSASPSPSFPPTPPLSPTPPGEARASTQRVRERASAPAHELDPRAQQAVALWLAHLARVGPTHCIADEVVEAVARDFEPATFAAGVEAHIGAELRWWQRTPLAALRKRCEWARERPATPAPLVAATLPSAPTPASQKPEKPRLTLVRPDGTSLVLRADPALVSRVAEGVATDAELRELQSAKFSFLNADGYPLPAVRGNPCPFTYAAPELQTEFLERRREARVEVVA